MIAFRLSKSKTHFQNLVSSVTQVSIYIYIYIYTLTESLRKGTHKIDPTSSKEEESVTIMVLTSPKQERDTSSSKDYFHLLAVQL